MPKVIFDPLGNIMEQARNIASKPFVYIEDETDEPYVAYYVLDKEESVDMYTELFKAVSMWYETGEKDQLRQFTWPIWVKIYRIFVKDIDEVYDSGNIPDISMADSIDEELFTYYVNGWWLNDGKVEISLGYFE